MRLDPTSEVTDIVTNANTAAALPMTRMIALTGGPRRPPAYPHRGPIKRPSIYYRTGPLGGPTSDKNAYILGQISVKDRSRNL